jgi:flagellin
LAAVNSGIQAAATTPGASSAAFAAANITASIHTDSLGQQQLSFTSANTAFQVKANDLMSDALIGNVTTLTNPLGVAGGTLVSGGDSMLGTKGTPNTQTDLAYTAVSAAEGSQTVTLSANDASGTAHTLSVNLTLANSTTMAATLGVINNALQASDDSTLKQITAVDNAGATTLNFISNLSNFQVSLGSTLAGATGLGSVAQHGTTISSLQVGAGGTADIGTIAGAQAAVSAITAAVGTLGVAQAAVGTGENQLAFASSLAQSQITNFSSAESQIRDANVAQQAANLSKAQVLQQSSIAAMAQANAEPQALLTLLKQ